MASNVVVRACHSARSRGDASPVSDVDDTWLDRRATKRSESGYGSGRRSKASQTLTIVVVAPMPSASVSTATSVKPRDFRRLRAAYRRSLRIASMFPPPPLDFYHDGGVNPASTAAGAT